MRARTERKEGEKRERKKKKLDETRWTKKKRPSGYGSCRRIPACLSLRSAADLIDVSCSRCVEPRRTQQNPQQRRRRRRKRFAVDAELCVRVRANERGMPAYKQEPCLVSCRKVGRRHLRACLLTLREKRKEGKRELASG